jgi:hypothetical protein
VAEGIPDLFLDTINVLSDSAWGGIAVAVLILIPALGFIGGTIRRRRARDLTCDELKLLKSFNEEAKGKPGAYLSVELAAYRAEVDKCETKVRRLKDLGYLQDSNIKVGYLGHRPVWITAKGVQRARKWR